MIKLSIIIPVYNTDTFLRNCLDSILTQPIKNIEIILIDDGSKDESPIICDEYAKKYSFIHVYHTKNNGASAARNLGIEKAKGENIMFVDSDDTLTTGWQNTLNDITDEDIIIFDRRLEKTRKEDIIKYIIGNNSNGIQISAPTSKIFKNEFLRSNNILFENDIIHGEDMLFLLEILDKTTRVKIVPKNIYNYHVYTGSSSHRFDKKIFSSDLLFHNKVAALTIAEEYKTYLIQNAVFTLLQKISYIKTYKEAKKYYHFIDNKIYKNALEKRLLVQKKFKVFITLFKCKQYKTLYHLLKIVQKISEK